MSIKWMTAVWDEATEVKETALLVLLSIADHAQDDHPEAWPTVARLAQRSRCDERTIQRALVTLEESGWLSRTIRPGHSTMYRIHRPGGDSSVTPDKMSPPTPVSPHPRQGRHPRGDSGVTQNHKRTTNEPGGGVVEVTTDAAPPDPVTERPFPGWARAALGSVTERQAGEWVTAWRSVNETAQEWDPGQNLTKYLARCKERKKAPSPDEWVRWFAEDDLKAQREARALAASTNQETPPQWWE